MAKISEKELKTSSLLFDESPLVVRPEMARRIGLNEAIVVQQIHYWLENKRKSTKEKDLSKERTYIDGRFWTYDSYTQWQKQFPFWSVRTIERIFTGLEKKGILLSGCFNEWETDRTKWYTIDYEALDNYKKPAKKKPTTKKKEVEILSVSHDDKLAECAVEQSDKLADSSRQVDVLEDDKLWSPIPKTSNLDLHSKNSNKTTTNTNTENLSSSRDNIDQELMSSFPNAPFVEIKQQVLSDNTAIIKTDKQYKAIMKFRLANWKPESSKKTATRIEQLPEWFDKKDQKQPVVDQDQLNRAALEEERRLLKEELKMYKKA